MWSMSTISIGSCVRFSRSSASRSNVRRFFFFTDEFDQKGAIYFQSVDSRSFTSAI